MRKIKFREVKQFTKFLYLGSCRAESQLQSPIYFYFIILTLVIINNISIFQKLILLFIESTYGSEKNSKTSKVSDIGY